MNSFRYTSAVFLKRPKYWEVIIYYSKDAEKFRQSTRVKVLPIHVTPDGEIAATHPNYVQDMDEIATMHIRIEAIVHAYVTRFGEKPSVSWLQAEYKKPYRRAQRILKDIFCYWPEYIAHKIEVNRDIRLTRIWHARNAVSKFHQTLQALPTFQDLNQEYFNRLVHYLIEEYAYTKGYIQGQTPKYEVPAIGFNNDVAIKILNDFLAYLKFVRRVFKVSIRKRVVQEYVEIAKTKYEVRPSTRRQKWELTLTPDEIQFLANLDFYEPDYWHSLSYNQKRYIHISLFMALQGLAPADTVALKRTDISDHQIVKDRIKSGIEFAVELDPISEWILELYDYNLQFVDQSINRALKKLFVSIFEFYRLHYEKITAKPYTTICKQRVKKGIKEEIRIEHRGLFVEAMTFRRSFGTNYRKRHTVRLLKDVADKLGHSAKRPHTTLDYVHEGQRNEPRISLFGVFRIKGFDYS